MHQLIETICEKNSYESKEFYQAIDASIIGWHSRSIAAALFIFGCDDNGSLYVLAAKRGVGASRLYQEIDRKIYNITYIIIKKKRKQNEKFNSYYCCGICLQLYFLQGKQDHKLC